MKKNSIKVVVAGCRNFFDYKFVEQVLYDQFIYSEIPVIIIHGAASGVDSLADKFANEYFYDKSSFPADWKTYGKSAGMIRNKQMAIEGDALIAFWDGKSKGTGNMIDEMRKLNKPVRIVNIDI